MKPLVGEAYDWTIAYDGSVAGLVAGDHGWEYTTTTLAGLVATARRLLANTETISPPPIGPSSTALSAPSSRPPAPARF